MKTWKKLFVCLLLAISFVLPSFFVQTETRSVAANGTGYTEASDVKYVKSGKYVANWGAREEECVFLTTYAQDFYTGNYVYDTMSQLAGSSSESGVPKSALYKSLQTLMKSKHSYVTSYEATKNLFCYTDCLQSNYSKISSFYSGTMMSGTWGSGWNREHTWPNSKGDASGSGEDDIMMLRPTSTSENSSRGNKAYGESSKSYYDPNELGQELRGDCARIVLYVYVRWGCTNTGSGYNPTGIFGTKGVIESLTLLLRWMEEDPVDTWEMGRNDAVQSITGTRNVFVDYPEYAWLLFGQEIPNDMTTPSGIAKGGSTNSSSSSSSSSSSVENSSEEINSSIEENSCQHEYGRWFVIKKPTETEEGERERFCQLCGQSQKESIPVVIPESSSVEASSEEVGSSVEESSSVENSSEEISSSVETSSESVDSTVESSAEGHNSAVESSPAASEQSPTAFGCSSSVGATMGGVFVLLTSCAFVYKRKKKE